MLRRPSLLVLAVLAVWGCLASPAAAPAQALTQAQPHRPACSADLPQTSNGAVVLPVADNCTWDIRLDPSTTHVVIEGSRPVLGLYSYASATPAVFAAAGAAPGIAAESPGVRLQLERLVLVRFQVAAPDAAQPVLWPGGLTAGHGEYMNMTDVRVIVDSQELFNKYLEFFTNQNTLLWTDNANFLHIQQWSNARTQLRSVGVLLAAPGSPPAAVPAVKNCLMFATNTTLLPALLPAAAMATPAPLLVYLTSNVTLGAQPALPASGVVIRRPVVFVGLQSVITSIDFQMVVNQLNVSAQHSNTTFVGLALENLAPGDGVTSEVAAPFSIAVVNNVWAVYYNRSTPHDVRGVMNNVTMVLPQDSEMSYVTYMFTLYNSPLPGLRAQTQFYSDVLHMSMLQFRPGPGTQAITVTHLYSWYHRWGDVVLTTQPQVAQRLPLPSQPVPVLTSSTRASPLVQAVLTGDQLQAFAEQPVLGDRDHILLFLANITLPDADPDPDPSGANSSAIELASPMLWIGYKPGVRGRSPLLLNDAAAGTLNDSGGAYERISLNCDHAPSAVLIPPSLPKNALQLQQLVLTHLPQGPGAAVPGTFKAVPAALFTLMLWTFDRPQDGERSLNLGGVTLMLPQPELDYFRAFAEASNFFVVEMSGAPANTPGQQPDAFSFENAYFQEGVLRASSVTGPGFLATNVTLLADPDAVAAMPGGYFWPDPSQLHVPTARPAQPAWVMAVIAVCVALGALILALGGYTWWQRKRRRLRDAECGQLFGSDGGSGSCKPPSHATGSQQSRLNSDHIGNLCSRVCTSGSPCPSCAALRLAHGASCRSSDVPHLLGSGSACAALGVNQSPVAKRKGAGLAAGAAALAGGAAAGSAAHEWRTQEEAGSPPGGVRQGSKARDVTSHRDASPQSTLAAGDPDSSSLASNVAAGMQRWRAAVSSTTMLLMERRMDAAAAMVPTDSNSSRVASTSASIAPLGAATAAAAAAAPPAAAPLPPGQQAQASQQQQSDSAGSGSSSAAAQQPLQLLELLGQGSFGSVFLALWHGKRVAVKVMQLPADALLDPGEQLSTEHQQHQEQGDRQQQQQQPGLQTEEEESLVERRRRLQRQRQQNSRPHMAIMEAVVSSAMSHPNVIQVYTYTLTPLTSSPADMPADPSSRHKQLTSEEEGGGSSGRDISGWCVRLIMEYANEGSLRDALDCGLLAKPGSFLAPSAVLALAHDVAAAMLHLHSEAIVHGDLKAGNVMLTSRSVGSLGSPPSISMWASSSRRPLTAKVADFGLALPLGPADTHATLLARGTPTHMSPELLLSGHVSKASDVYAYGILLFEIMTGQRAYAGIPVPLLPHEVAMQGTRPQWPPDMPPGCRDLRKLAEACWAQKPQDRPTFAGILQTLDIWSAGGHGWPAVPLTSRVQPTKHKEQQQVQGQQLQQGRARDAPLNQPPLRQQQGQQTQDGALSPALPAGSPRLQGAGAGAPPAARQPLVQPAARTNGEAGLNMHMSWSEVDMNE